MSNPNVVVSSLKPSKDGELVLRIYEAAGQPARGVTVKLAAAVQSAREANLMEDPGATIETAGDAIKFDLTPFEIKTVRLRLGAMP